MRTIHRRLTTFLLLACLLAQALFPVSAHAYDAMTAGEACIDLIKRYESFSDKMYQSGGKWYIGYGSQTAQGAYPDGITEDEATALLREDLTEIESSLNAFFANNGITPTQGQFDALTDFTYTLGTSWLSGSSALIKYVRGSVDLDRRDVFFAFGVWSHSGGKVLSSLAQRRMEEAALYLDGNTDGAAAYAYLAIEKNDGATRSTDFGVYERGEAYDVFPAMFRLGYTLDGLRTADGSMIRLGDMVEMSQYGSPVWVRNTYSAEFEDVESEDWYYDYVMELSETGVVNGRSEGVFDPAADVTVAEALKLILLAAGGEAQEPTGEHWASGYLDYARDTGVLPVALTEELDRPILRKEAAELAARAIGYGQSFIESPFADTKNGYAIALYELGVINGISEHNQSFFYPDKTLTRAEISTIVWRLQNILTLGKTQTATYVIGSSTRTTEVASGVALNDLYTEGFSGSGNSMSYNGAGVTMLRGVDISKFQGDIDWSAVRQSGLSFAIIRVGGRYQGSGEIYTDTKFEENYQNASEQGLTLGFYFYSQAINVEEAVEEADFVLDCLAGKVFDGPIVFDWETAGTSGARTAKTPVKTVSDCAVAFCERIRSAGYSPMVYMNTYDGYVRYDLSRLADYDIWYAGEYNGAYPKFVYRFVMWQYTSKGSVNGIEGNVDMDLWFLR